MSNPPVNPFAMDPGTAAQADRDMRKRFDADHAKAVNLAMAAGQPGFSLREEDARRILDDAYALFRDLTALRDQADGLKALTPPAQDQASLAYNKKLTNGGSSSFFSAASPWDSAAAFDAGVDHVEAELLYVKTMIDKLEEALGITHNTDEENAATVKTAANGQEGSRF
jgi:hypothetical protein